MTPLKGFLISNDGGVWGDEPTGHNDVAVVRSTDITIDGKWCLADIAYRHLEEVEARRASLQVGDLVVVKSSGSAAHLGKTALVGDDVKNLRGGFSNFTQRLRPRPSDEPRYLWYLLNSSFAREQLAWLGTTSTGLRNLSGGMLGELLCPHPGRDTQRSIADFLDRETARIDALVAAKSRMIGLLTDRMFSRVSTSTSVGRRVRVRRVISVLTSGPRGWAEKVGECGRPFIRSANLCRDDIELKAGNLVFVDVPDSGEAKRSRTRNGDVLIGITGANTGWVGLVRPAHTGGYVSQHVAMLRPTGVVAEWLAYSLFSRQTQDMLLSSQYGGTKQQLGLEDLADLTINLPGHAEQQRVVTLLDQARAQTSSAISALDRQLTLLRERRQALITAAVTGQLDIPSTAA
jgi:type I restriction enzyme S subunit